MFSDSARQPLYLRSSNAAQASDDDAFWRTLQDKMASYNENVTTANGHGQDNERSHALPVFADLAGGNSPPQKQRAERRPGGASWLLGFAGLDDAFAPDLVRVPSSDSESDSDDDSVSSPPPAEPAKKRVSFSSAVPPPLPAKKRVSFSSAVEVREIPDASSLSSAQRRRMYSSTSEVRRNKIRNKKEFRYDGYDWRNATEEQDMGVCEVTGELVHPAHDHELWC